MCLGIFCNLFAKEVVGCNRCNDEWQVSRVPPAIKEKGASRQPVDRRVGFFCVLEESVTDVGYWQEKEDKEVGVKEHRCLFCGDRFVGQICQ